MADTLDLNYQGMTGTLEVHDTRLPDGTAAVRCEIVRPLTGIAAPSTGRKVYGYLTYTHNGTGYTLVRSGKGKGRVTRLYNDIVQYRLTPEQAAYIGGLLDARATAMQAAFAAFAADTDN